MKFDVQGRTVIVTGWSKGIGYGIAEVFADADALVTIVGRDRDVAAQAAARQTDRGASVHWKETCRYDGGKLRRDFRSKHERLLV